MMFTETEWIIILVALLILVITLCIGAVLWTSRNSKKSQSQGQGQGQGQDQDQVKHAPLMHFMTQSEARAFISADSDNYVRNMSAVDLHARHTGTRMQYIERVTKACTDFTPSEKRRVRALCNAIDASFTTPILSIPVKNNDVDSSDDEDDADDESDSEVLTIDMAQKAMFITHDNDTLIAPNKKTKAPKKQLMWNINTALLKNLPWIFVKTTAQAYEDGLPHTRGPNVICLSTQTLHTKNTVLKRTMLHEKVHIYQRVYPEQTASVIKAAGYHKTTTPRNTIPLIRANPDLDKWIYEDANGKPMLAVYNSAKPSGISDISNKNSNQEHPYESMAYAVGGEHLISIQTRKFPKASF